MSELLGFGKESLPSVIKDPFDKNNVTDIRVSLTKWRDTWEANGTVEFQNGNTKGQQKFKAETFDDVVRQIKAMIDNL